MLGSWLGQVLFSNDFVWGGRHLCFLGLVEVGRMLSVGAGMRRSPSCQNDKRNVHCWAMTWWDSPFGSVHK